MQHNRTTVTDSTQLKDRLDGVRQRIEDACAHAKRDPRQVMLIAVTKYAAPEQIRRIIQLGVGDLGESRVQNLTPRAAQINEFYQRKAASGQEGLPPQLRWHMIGRLQRNKVKAVLPLVSLIHSVDSLRLAEEIETYSAKIDKVMPVLLEVNVGEEAQKGGVAVGAAIHLAEQIDTMPHVRLCGLMAMAPQFDDPEKTRPVFARAREIFDEMQWHKIGGSHLRHLSMGMSADFEQAIAEGSTMVRLGSALFGEPPGPPSDI